MKRFSIVVAATLALAVAGCAGSEDNDFKQQFNEAQAPLQQVVNDTSADPNKIDQLADGLDQTAERMRALEAPDDAKAQFDAFIKEVESGADAMRAAGEAVKSGDPTKMTEAVTSLQETMSKVGTAQANLQKAVDG